MKLRSLVRQTLEMTSLVRHAVAPCLRTETQTGVSSCESLHLKLYEEIISQVINKHFLSIISKEIIVDMYRMFPISCIVLVSQLILINLIF